MSRLFFDTYDDYMDSNAYSLIWASSVGLFYIYPKALSVCVCGGED